MDPSLFDSTPKSIEQLENELYLFTHPRTPGAPVERAAVQPEAVSEDEKPPDEDPSFSDTIRQRFTDQRQRITRHLSLINDVRQTLAQLRHLLEKPPPPK